MRPARRLEIACLAEENKRLWQQLQEQSAARGCQVYNDILCATPPPAGALQNLTDAMQEAARMQQPSTEQGCQVMQWIQELIVAAADHIPAPS